MEDILREPVELTTSELEAVAGGGYYVGSFNGYSFNNNGNGNGNGNGNASGNYVWGVSANGNGNGNGNGVTIIG